MAMAGRKIWRDAATLILTAKAPGGKSLPSSFTRLVTVKRIGHITTNHVMFQQ
jgi:hypothetical protein